MQELKCHKCNETKALPFFNRNGRVKRGFQYSCRDCQKKHHLSYYKEEKNNINARVKQKRKQNPERTILNRIKDSARRRGLDFNLTLEDIIIPEYCPVLGIKLEKGEVKICPYSPSVDRIDNNKGYIKGNVAIISSRANAIKYNATIEDLLKVIEYIKNYS